MMDRLVRSLLFSNLFAFIVHAYHYYPYCQLVVCLALASFVSDFDSDIGSCWSGRLVWITMAFWIAFFTTLLNNSSPLDHRRSGNLAWIAKLIGVPSIMVRTRVLSHGLDSGKIPGRKKGLPFGIRTWENSVGSYGLSELICKTRVNSWCCSLVLVITGEKSAGNCG